MTTPERPKLTARDLKRRYFNGERDFAHVDLSGANLQGLNLRDINLSHAILSHAQLQGTRFTHATLQGAYLDHVQAGLQRRWMVMYLALLLPVTALLSFVSSVFGAAFIDFFFQKEDEVIEELIDQITVIPGIVVTAMVFGMFLVVARQGLTFKALNTILDRETGTDTFTYTISDGDGGTAIITITGLDDGGIAPFIVTTAPQKFLTKYYVLVAKWRLLWGLSLDRRANWAE